MITPSGATAAQIWASVKAGEPIHAELEFLSQGITLTDDDFELNGGIEVSNVLNGDIDLVFGRAVAKQLTCHILNSSKLNGLIWTDEIQLTWKIDVNGVEKSVPGGYFCGEKPANVTTDNVIEFTAYDRMKKFDILVDGYLDTVTYPITIGNFYNGLCTFCGVSKVSGDELPNMIGRTLSAAPADFQGYTCRDVLAWIAEACGCYAMCNADGNIQLRWFTDYTSHSVSEHEEFDYESGDINDGLTWDEADQLTWDQIDMMTWNDVGGWQETFTVDQLSVKSLGENVTIDYPSAIGGNVYTIIDNPFLFVETPQDVTNYIKPIYDRLALFGAYLPMKLECIGDPTVEAGDIITVVIEGNTLTVPIFVKTTHWNGSMVDECETTGQQQRDTYTSDANRQKVLDNNSIRLFVKGKYYEHQSGIEITPDGVTVSGGKYVDIESGGSFNVDATDFKISSENKNIIIGDCTINKNGILWKGIHSVLGDYYMGFGSTNIVPSKPSVSYATVVSKVSSYEVESAVIYLKDSNLDVSNLQIDKRKYGVHLSSHLNNGGSTTQGRIILNHIAIDWELEESDLNNCINQGTYYFNSSVSNKPNGYTSGGYLFVDAAYTTINGGTTLKVDRAIQTITTLEGVVYKRVYAANTWEPWYKFTGTLA